MTDSHAHMDRRDGKVVVKSTRAMRRHMRGRSWPAND